jgi:hypothetical protein
MEERGESGMRVYSWVSGQIELKFRYVFGAQADSRCKFFRIGCKTIIGNELKRKHPRLSASNFHPGRLIT